MSADEYDWVLKATPREARIIKFWLFIAFTCLVLAIALGAALTPWYIFLLFGTFISMYIADRYGGDVGALLAISTYKPVKRAK